MPWSTANCPDCVFANYSSGRAKGMEWAAKQLWRQGTTVKIPRRQVAKVGYVNSWIDCPFVFRPFTHILVERTQLWVGLFQPHVDMSKLNWRIFLWYQGSSFTYYLQTLILETLWKQNGNFPSTQIFPMISSLQEPICCNSRPFSWEPRVDIGGSYLPELRFLKIKLLLLVFLK